MSPAAIRLISSMATREVLATLCADWQRGGGRVVETIAAGGVDVAKRVRQGEAFDVVVLARDVVDALCTEGHLRSESRRDLVRSGIAVAVPAGARAPDIGSEEALRQAVLDATTLGYSTGPSGNYLLGLFERWGILETVRPRFVQPPPGVPVGSLVASGRVALGFQQLSELIGVQGIQLLGPLPAAVQSLTVFSAAVHASSAQEQDARALLAFLTMPERAATLRRLGMDPAD